MATSKRLSTDQQLAVIASLNQTAAAKLISRTARSLRDCRDAPRLRNGDYDGPAIVAWLVAREAPDLDADMLAGGDSPGLERFRAAKAALAELDLEERRHTLISVEKTHEAMIVLAGLLRRLGKALGSRYGREVQQSFHDTLAEFDRIIVNRFGEPSEQSIQAANQFQQEA